MKSLPWRDPSRRPAYGDDRPLDPRPHDGWLVTGTKLSTTVVRAAGWVAVLAIGVVSLVPGQGRPHVLSQNQWEHLAAYVVAGMLLGTGYPRSKTMVLIGVALTAYGGALELAQLWVPGRMARLTDFGHSALGAWIGLTVIFLVRWSYLQWRQLPPK